MCIGIRYTVSTCSYSSSRHGHPKLREKCFLFIHWHALHLVELQQDHHTFASSLSFSRIDRIYTNLHPAIHMFHELFAHVLDKVVGVSDHYPVLFGIRAAGKHSQIQRLPSWLVRHPCFAKNFQEMWEWNCDCHKHERGKGNPFDWLMKFKSCARQAGKITKRQLQSMSPRCLEEKIAIIGSFIASTLRNDDIRAHQVASRLDSLKDGAGNPLTVGSAAFNALLDEYLENTHRQIQTEMQSLQDKKHQLTKFEVAQRKNHLWKRLQRMLPGNSVDLVRYASPMAVQLPIKRKWPSFSLNIGKKSLMNSRLTQKNAGHSGT